MIWSLLRRVPRSSLFWLQRWSAMRWIGRKVVFPLLPDSVSILSGAAEGMRIHRSGALISYLLGTDESGVQEVCRRWVEPGQVAYDIGGHVGYLSLILARQVGSKGRVIVFEPSSQAASRLSSNLQLNDLRQVELFQRAVFRETGRAPFVRYELASICSLVRNGVDSGSVVEVETVRLDDFVAEGHPAPDFIKIDVRGGEVDVLDGMEEVLAQNRPVLVIENHGLQGIVAHRLEAADYEVRVLGGSEPLSEAAWNAVALAVPRERATEFEKLSGFSMRR